MKTSYQKRSSRRSMLKGVAVGTAGVAAIAGLAVGGFVLEEHNKTGSAHAASSDDSSYNDNNDSIQTILNVAITAEHLAVTFYTNALKHANRLGFNDTARMDIKAALIEEQIHLNFLAKNGARPLTRTFSFPDGNDTFHMMDRFIRTQQWLETLFVAAYIVAGKEFAMLKRPDLVQVAGQIGTVEAEHRAVGRAIGGLNPANNHAFSPIVLQRVGDAPMILKNRGFLNPQDGNSYDYTQADLNDADVIDRSASDTNWDWSW